MPHTQNQERDVSLPILAMSGPGNFSRVEQNEAAGSTPSGDAFQGFSLAAILLPEPKHFVLSQCVERVMKPTTPITCRRPHGKNCNGT